MLGRKKTRYNAMPDSILAWQVELRRYTMEKRNGAPHAGVAPILTVSTPGVGHGITSHSIICGLLRREDQLSRSTAEFKAIYEQHVAEGARRIYDEGLEYMKGYYTDPEDFDRSSITTLLPSDGVVVQALRAKAECSLLFYVFDLVDQSNVGKLRCIQMNGRAELHTVGPVYENVWWHNALFHGPVDGQTVVRFRHISSYETGFGRLEPMD